MDIVFLGSKDIGARCLEILWDYCSNSTGNKISAVIGNSRATKMLEFAQEKSIRTLKNMEQFLELSEPDLVISVQYHEILKSKHLNHGKEFINLHLAPLPEYRGCNQFSAAIIDDCKEFGVTLHKMNSQVDSGDIVFETRFEIPDNIWVHDLFNMAETKGIQLFTDSLPKLISGNYSALPQSTLVAERGTKTILRNEINNMKKLNLAWPEDKTKKHIRATSMPGFEAPYFEIDGKKAYVVLGKEYEGT